KSKRLNKKIELMLVRWRVASIRFKLNEALQNELTEIMLRDVTRRSGPKATLDACHAFLNKPEVRELTEREYGACGKKNVLTGFTKVLAFRCRYCGDPVSLEKKDREQNGRRDRSPVCAPEQSFTNKVA